MPESREMTRQIHTHTHTHTHILGGGGGGEQPQVDSRIRTQDIGTRDDRVWTLGRAAPSFRSCNHSTPPAHWSPWLSPIPPPLPHPPPLPPCSHATHRYPHWPGTLGDQQRHDPTRHDTHNVSWMRVDICVGGNSPTPPGCLQSMKGWGRERVRLALVVNKQRVYVYNPSPPPFLQPHSPCCPTPPPPAPRYPASPSLSTAERLITLIGWKFCRGGGWGEWGQKYWPEPG